MRVIGRLDHFHICAIYLRTHSPAGPALPADPAIAHRVFDRQNVDELLEQATRPELDMTEEFIREAIGKGDFCTATLVDGKIVSYGWSAFTRTQYELDGVDIVFPSGYRYGYRAFTVPEFRGRRLRYGAMPLRDSYCAERGCTQSLAYIRIGNFASLKTVPRLGITRIGFALLYKNGPRFISWHSPGVKRIGLRFALRVDCKAH
ncbi:MAG: hypothetical protein ABI423_09605 [Burkholderiales bacterium]